MSQRPTYVIRIFIKTTPERLRQALTSLEHESTLPQVLTLAPVPHRIVHVWSKIAFDNWLRPIENPPGPTWDSVAIWEIDSSYQGACLLSLRYQDIGAPLDSMDNVGPILEKLDDAGDKLSEEYSIGWAWIVSDLKTRLETGTGMG